MALTRAEVQATFSAANSAVIDDGQAITSDAITPHANATPLAMLHVQADVTAGAAINATDTVDVFILYTGGDREGSGSDDYDTVEHAVFVCTLNLAAADPARASREVSIQCKGYQIRFVNNSTVSDRQTTVSANLTEQRT